MARPRLIALLLALITVVAYLPVRQASFIVFDDPDYVTENSVVQAGLTGTGLKWAFAAFHSSNWHPVTWLSHMLDCELFGVNAGAHHLVNVLFHAANAVLLFWFFFRTTAKLWPSALVAALFAWHPLHVESVAWISERKDVLSAFFGILTLLFYAAAAKDKEQRNGSAFNSRYALALACYVIGLMAKPMLVTWPFVLLLLDVWPLKRITIEHPGRNLAALALEKWPFFAITAASSVITFLAQRGDAVVSLERYPASLRFGNALVAYALYLWKTIWPARLTILYPLPPEIPGWHIAAAAVLLVAISMAAWLSRRNASYLLVGWLWFLGTLVPVIGLVQVGAQAMADRYSYIPLIGIFIAVAFGARDIVERLKIKPLPAGIAAALVLLATLFATEYQLQFWKNSETLFRRAIAITKDNAVAHTNLGVALEQQGRRDEALAEYRQAMDIKPDLVQLHNNIANLLDELGRRDEAMTEYREALRLNPNAPLAHANYGTLLIELGRYEEGLQEYRVAAQLAPDDPRPHYLMGKASLRRGQIAEAISHFREALRINADDVQTLTWLSRVLASDQDAAIRNGTAAIQLAERANALTGGEQPFVLDTLAMAYAEGGRFDDAQRAAKLAIQLAAGTDAKDVETMRQHLISYQASRPVREDFRAQLPSPEKKNTTK